MNIWRNISIFFGGIITGILVYMKLKDPEIKNEVNNITSENYTNVENQEGDKVTTKTITKTKTRKGLFSFLRKKNAD